MAPTSVSRDLKTYSESSSRGASNSYSFKVPLGDFIGIPLVAPVTRISSDFSGIFLYAQKDLSKTYQSEEIDFGGSKTSRKCSKSRFKITLKQRLYRHAKHDKSPVTPAENTCTAVFFVREWTCQRAIFLFVKRTRSVSLMCALAWPLLRFFCKNGLDRLPMAVVDQDKTCACVEHEFYGPHGVADFL